MQVLKLNIMVAEPYQLFCTDTQGVSFCLASIHKCMSVLTEISALHENQFYDLYILEKAFHSWNVI